MPRKTKPKSVLRTTKKVSLKAHPYGPERHPDLDWQSSKLHKSLQRLPEAERDTVKKALELARKRHEGQTRQGGSPYIIHPIRMANILMTEWGLRDADALAATMLHDVVEDTPTTIKEVKDVFGEAIGRLVDGMTMWKGSETYELYCKRLARGSETLRIIKCADVLDNLRSWHEVETFEAFPRWWRQVNDWILPIADNTYEPAAASLRLLLNDGWFLKMAEME